MKINVVELINRRRHQIIVHSAIYYEYNDNLITDTTFDNWCKELVQLSTDFPIEAREAGLHREFEGFDGSTGAFLPYHDYRTMAKAEYLIKNKRK